MTTHSDITAIGGLVRDPDLKYASTGTAVVTFTVACGRRFQRNGQWEEDTAFLDCVMFGDAGQNVAASLRKGDRVIVSGRIDQNNWEDREGNKRSKLQIVADEVGASMKWNQLEIQRQERSKANEDGSTSYRSDSRAGDGSDSDDF